MTVTSRATAAATALVLGLAVAAPALAQGGDLLADARSAAVAGRRTEAQAMLEARLQESPRDVDARLLLGLVLSWDGRYEDANRELRQVLDQSPAYNDARLALANVAWWTGRYDQLRELAAAGRSQRPSDPEWILLEARALDGLGRHREARDAVTALLAESPGHPQARAFKARLDAKFRPWTLTVGYGGDRFSDGRTPWAEYSAAIGRETPAGSIIGRMSRAERFGVADRQFELEAYPSFRPGTYAYASIGLSQDDTLYPNYRVAADLYQSLGHGYEVSAGFRRLGFSSATTIYVGTLTKYVGNWMLTGKTFAVPDRLGPEDSVSFHGVVRRYIRGDGESFVGAGYSHGSNREEVGDRAELMQLGADTYRANAEVLVGRRTLLSVTASASRQDRALRSTLWQRTFGVSCEVRF